jgi:hypothetical protein
MSGNGKNDSGDGSGEDDSKAADKELEGMAYEPSVNQVRREPVPASHEEDKDQEAVGQNEEHWRRSASQENPAIHDQAAGHSGG